MGRWHQAKEAETKINTSRIPVTPSVLLVVKKIPMPFTPSVPEPPPLNKGESVPELLIAELQRQRDLHDYYPVNAAFMNAQDLVRARDAFGRQKYGQPLMTQDGRNSIEDAKQELGDLLQYAYKAQLNGESLKELQEMVPVLLAILKLPINQIP